MPKKAKKSTRLLLKTKTKRSQFKLMQGRCGLKMKVIIEKIQFSLSQKVL